MFNPFDLNPEATKTLIAALNQTVNNPIAMLKLNVLSKSLTLKTYVETNAPQLKKNFALVWSGFEAQTAKLFDDFENDLMQKLSNNSK